MERYPFSHTHIYIYMGMAGKQKFDIQLLLIVVGKRKYDIQLLFIVCSDPRGGAMAAPPV